MKYEVSTPEFREMFLNKKFKDNPLVRVSIKTGWLDLYYLPFLMFGLPDQIWMDNLFAYDFRYSKKLNRPYKTKRCYIFRYWKAIAEALGYKFDINTFSVDEFKKWVGDNDLDKFAFEIPKRSVLLEWVKSGKKTYNNFRKQSRMFDKMFEDGAKEFQDRQAALLKNK